MRNTENDRKDWSRRFLPGVTINHLDQQAIAFAREKYKEKMNRLHISEEVDGMTDEEFLTMLHLMSEGKVTNAAMLLLGNPKYKGLFEYNPSITWRLFGFHGNLRDYEVFNIPFVNVTEKIIAKIRILTYRYMPDPMSVYPIEIQQYDTRILRELVNNAMMHSDYELVGAIDVNEEEECIRIINHGRFLPESVETLLEKDSVPTFCRNQLLAEVMEQFNMIDPASRSIKQVYRLLQERSFPMPEYDLSSYNQVSVTVYAKMLNEQYTYMLFKHPEFDLKTVYLLDQVAKGNVRNLSEDNIEYLRKQKLIHVCEDRWVVSSGLDQSMDVRQDRVKDEPSCDQYYYDLIAGYLNLNEKSWTKDIGSLFKGILSDCQSRKQRDKKIADMVVDMRNKGVIYSDCEMKQIATAIRETYNIL